MPHSMSWLPIRWSNSCLKRQGAFVITEVKCQSRFPPSLYNAAWGSVGHGSTLGVASRLNCIIKVNWELREHRPPQPAPPLHQAKWTVLHWENSNSCEGSTWRINKRCEIIHKHMVVLSIKEKCTIREFYQVNWKEQISPLKYLYSLHI